MTVVNHETGEILDVDRAAAERRAERIGLRLDSIADNYVAVMPMIRESISKRDDLALGYASPGDYVRDRFGGALHRLGVDVRRAVVHELTEAGLSTRAIAPVVGVSQKTVSRDAQVSHLTHQNQTPEPVEHGEGDAGSGQTTSPAAEVQGTEGAQVDEVSTGAGERQADPEPPAAPAPVIGLDGKRYQRQQPKPLPEFTRAKFIDDFNEKNRDLAMHVASYVAPLCLNGTNADRLREWAWACVKNADGASPVQRKFLTPEHIRAAADVLHDLADEMENVDD